MRVVIPTSTPDGLLAKRGAHFGKAPFYVIVDIENNEIKDINFVQNPGHSGGACGNAVMNIKNLGADVLVVSGIGQRPLLGFQEAGIKVFFDDKSQIVKESIDRLLNNEIKEISLENACGRH
ncbi:dinitrogenase iron-molybdenum cofactor biosynthesis protein [Caminibacter mediatlanticus TB-2]|uniref:Dinitrogenase iron-molybdenum cofactor biosynthesis protein n=1 Tax=Caminibacter mediatlanticus TB-2 TaxID=391592 RepID=A0ABX5V748_9BACT|nr:NifB/NifX family molybdenum-iron cluster-binding protein [Caminibacter mediatlanticus]QCT94100.1 dinitrogenase iron-molybdenum cofactor biosynthesis protein [Caminibacter mediatlanticus TB-2]